MDPQIGTKRGLSGIGLSPSYGCREAERGHIEVGKAIARQSQTTEGCWCVEHPIEKLLLRISATAADGTCPVVPMRQR